jgi:hypothetical protein
MVHIYYEITIYIYKEFFLQGTAFPSTLQGGQSPLQLPLVEGCTLFHGVNSSWGINMDENKNL